MVSPRRSPYDLAREWYDLFAPDNPGWKLGLGAVPQLTTVSHDGGCVDRSGACVSLHPDPPQPRYPKLPSTRATRYGRPVTMGGLARLRDGPVSARSSSRSYFLDRKI